MSIFEKIKEKLAFCRLDAYILVETAGFCQIGRNGQKVTATDRKGKKWGFSD